MLNYIWSGLIIGSLLFALTVDTQELVENRFRNETALPVALDFPDGYAPDARRQPVEIRIDSATYRDVYGVNAAPDPVYAGTLVQTQEGRKVEFDPDADLPEPLATIQSFHATDDNPALRGALQGTSRTTAGVGRTETALQFEPVRFRKLNDIAQAALNFAETAASLALSLIGVLGLMLGLVKIGEEAGLIESLTGIVQPILSPLFPNVPDDHPALANISLNLLANVFGLGNAATPLGIKAMEDLQELNPSDEKASDDMVMLLALNTSSVQLVPPSLLVAIMGLQINQLFFSITLATLCSTVAGILGTLALHRLPYFRATAPHRTADAEDPDE
ncbi:spore maturation protein A [Salinibacter ruber]|jgi:spore maturation protein A|nr:MULTISPECIES: nucleoside recognition domain-containing protein [Salinibacter]MBB4060545.1 spore maturation protein A [Salinibacter ruber]MBB4067914.1 spore maturation protein A [Salinibacter ruber]MCS3632593.1 spore maturation protein A [Salinibacter ruber]MCS3636431.1 spore maturation protein A [Salinibacter ruber]MCS3644500.1 spore maturation protein A [Salinibacter ruber]